MEDRRAPPHQAAGAGGETKERRAEACVRGNGRGCAHIEGTETSPKEQPVPKWEMRIINLDSVLWSGVRAEVKS